MKRWARKNTDLRATSAGNSPTVTKSAQVSWLGYGLLEPDQSNFTQRIDQCTRFQTTVESDIYRNVATDTTLRKHAGIQQALKLIYVLKAPSEGEEGSTEAPKLYEVRNFEQGVGLGALNPDFVPKTRFMVLKSF